MRMTSTIRRTVVLAGLGIAATSVVALAAMSPAQQAVYDYYTAAAKKAGPAFTGFSAEKGRAFFYAKQTGGKPDSPSCTSCHTENLKSLGKTRAGKDIQPMAASANPKRFTDLADVEKWFSRNCPDVLGRECTVTEKGDVLAYLLSQ
jgi:hypothetical protein